MGLANATAEPIDAGGRRGPQPHAGDAGTRCTAGRGQCATAHRMRTPVVAGAGAACPASATRSPMLSDDRAKRHVDTGCIRIETPQWGKKAHASPTRSPQSHETALRMPMRAP